VRSPPIILTMIAVSYWDDSGERMGEWNLTGGDRTWLVGRAFDATTLDQGGDNPTEARSVIDIDGDLRRSFAVKETVEEIANLVDARRLS
jgi:hypothetical protein